MIREQRLRRAVRVTRGGARYRDPMLGVKAAQFGDIKRCVKNGAEGFGKTDGLHDDCSLSDPILPELGVPVSPVQPHPESRFEAFLNFVR